MKKLLLMLFVAILLGGFVVINTSTSNSSNKKSVYEYSALNIEGKDTSLEKYKGDVLLIVNTASQCGYTKQYEGLQAIYDQYKDKGFKVLGFPANNFNGQEPGTNEEIKEFCTTKFKVSFPLFAKISVKGEDAHPLYKFLTDKELNGEFGGDISWNFNKFLTNHKGEIVARFSSKVEPDSEEVTRAIEKYLEERESAKNPSKLSAK